MTTRVCLAIPTFRRPDLLKGLLAAIDRLQPLAFGATVNVVVLDNDPAQSAAEVTGRWKPVATFPIQYCPVSARGLSSVRNAALDVAERQADVLVMIDDDETPEPQWLNELLRVWIATEAAVVVGPVQAELPAGAPQWMRAFRERELPVYEDGASLREGWSGNALLDVRQVKAFRVRFNAAMNLTGGEDQLFFRQLYARGGSIRYAANATVWELLPATRCSLSSVLRRSFCRGGSLTACERQINPTAGILLLRLAKGVGLVVTGVLRVAPVFIVRGIVPATLLLCEIARGLGMLAAFFGLRYEAYRHGSS